MSFHFSFMVRPQAYGVPSGLLVLDVSVLSHLDYELYIYIYIYMYTHIHIYIFVYDGLKRRLLKWLPDHPMKYGSGEEAGGGTERNAYFTELAQRGRVTHSPGQWQAPLVDLASGGGVVHCRRGLWQQRGDGGLL